MGPLALMDLIGLDTAYEILDTMYHQGRDPCTRRPRSSSRWSAPGLKGRKSGRGFYTYAGIGSSEVVAGRAHPGRRGAEDPGLAKIAKVGVVGSGTMATGIMEVFAKAGYDVVYVARGQDKVDGVLASIKKGQARMIERGRLTQEAADAVTARLTGATEREAWPTSTSSSRPSPRTWRSSRSSSATWTGSASPGAILATTTSSLPIIQCANVTSRPGDVIGMHFFNPAQVMKLVEVVSTVATDPAITATTVALSRKVGKVPVQCGDRSGFIVNALLFPYLNDAIKMLEATTPRPTTSTPR
jgi:3-hydroxybutyryl-CoA dehydrogenase